MYGSGFGVWAWGLGFNGSGAGFKGVAIFGGTLNKKDNEFSDSADGSP